MIDRKIFNAILSIGKTLWLSILLTLLLSMIQIFIGNYTYVAFQQLLDGLTDAAERANAQLADLTPLLAIFIASNLANHILVYLEGVPSTILNKSVVQWVKLRALDKIFRIDYLAYQNLGTGNLIQIVENGAEATRRVLTDFYMAILLNLTQIFVALYFIRAYDQALFLIILAGYVIFYLFSYSLMRFLKRQVEKLLANQEDFSSLIVRAFMEMIVFRVNGRFKAEYERIKGISDEIVRTRTQVYLLQELSYTGFALLIFLVEAGVVVQQAGKILVGTSTVGTLVALTGFIRLVFFPIIGFGRAWMQYRLDTIAYRRMDDVLSLPDDTGLMRGGELVITRGEIVFDRVTFAYPGQKAAGEVEGQTDAPEILKDFSLVIAGGKTTALVGASGSGKSTLVRLLLHLLKPERGQVCVDGQDLSDKNLNSYYHNLAYVPQEPPIFDGSLRENLTFGITQAEGRLAEVIRQVGLEERVRTLPQGLETRVGERGIKLSGGERQRLAFGRVMLQDPRIVILDEPTSALDSLTEDRVTRQLSAFLQGRTVIIVAHRLQTIKDADTIVVLEQGKIVQHGRFETLVQQPGRFRQLWEKQMSSEQDTIGSKN